MEEIVEEDSGKKWIKEEDPGGGIKEEESWRNNQKRTWSESLGRGIMARRQPRDQRGL